MAINAVCGKACSVTVGGSAYSAHQFSLELTSNEIDVTGFASGDWGDFIACLKHAKLSVQFYEVPGVSIGDTVAWSAVLDYASPVTISGNGVVVEKGVVVDAKNVVENTLGIRCTGTITGV